MKYCCNEFEYCITKNWIYMGNNYYFVRGQRRLLDDFNAFLGEKRDKNLIVMSPDEIDVLISECPFCEEKLSI